MKISDDVRRVLSQAGTTGIAQSHLRSFAIELVKSGYSLLSARDYLRAANHFGRWAEKAQVRVGEFSNESIAEFARHKCACPGRSRHGHAHSHRSIALVRQFLIHLRRRGVVAVTSITHSPKTAGPLDGFRTWLAQHRGLKLRTIKQYEDRIKSMLPGLGSDPSFYSARLVRQVILAENRDRHRAYAKTFVTALRSFLRFLAAQGKCPPYLDRAIPAIRVWKLSALPRYLEAEDVERVIASCDLDRAQGLRDRAVLLLLARLGLRAADIVGLRIKDVDWVRGTVRVRGKGQKEVCLPLPQDAGDALIEYLKCARPIFSHERVFLCTNAPLRPFASSSVVSTIVRFAVERAGIANPPSRGAHLLRHSAATTLLRSGVSLDTVATLLRHESSDMTAHYAKVDITLLESVAQPWPEVASC